MRHGALTLVEDKEYLDQLKYSLLLADEENERALNITQVGGYRCWNFSDVEYAFRFLVSNLQT